MKQIKTNAFIFILFCALVLVSCATSPKEQSKNALSKTELEKITKLVPMPILPSEKVIRSELSRFKRIISSKRNLSESDWQLHDRLLNHYIWLKKGTHKPSAVVVPAKSRFTQDFESFCLDPYKASPVLRERYQWQEEQTGIPYLRELLEVISSGETSQESVQTIIWNLQNKTVWEDYPKNLQSILLQVDAEAAKKIPSRAGAFVQDRVSGFIKDKVSPSRVGEVVSFVQGRYYNYQEFRELIESTQSKQELQTSDMISGISDSVFVDTESNGFANQEITFYNSSPQDVVIDLSSYRLKSSRSDVQDLAVIKRGESIDASLAAEIEQVLFGDMARLGLGFIPVLGDLIDLYEASTGKDFFSDDWLSGEGRFLSAMGVLAGSGQQHRYARKVLEGPSSYVSDVQRDYRKIRNAKNHKALEKVEISLRGKNIPDDWRIQPTKLSKKEQGLEFIHPDNKHTRVRAMPGNPNAKFPNSRKPYVQHRVDGNFFDKDGNWVRLQSNEAHIPVEDYDYSRIERLRAKK